MFQTLKIPEHLKASAKMLRKACMAETNVDEKYINETKGGYVPDNPELKCYLLCILEHSGAIDEKGVVDFTVLLHMFSPDYKKSITHGMEHCATKRIYFSKQFV